MKKITGFTLLEVMIAIVILAILSALTASTIQHSLKIKAKLQTEIDRESQLRNAFRLIERDINLAFHYRNLTEEVQQTMLAPTPGPNGVVPPTPIPAPGTIQPTPMPNYTQFIGDEDAIAFTSLNHVRMMQDAKESDQEKVGYSIESCKGWLNDSTASKCLMRRTSPILDDDVTKGGTSIVLLENISSFKLKYFGVGKDDWVSTWKTDQNGDAATKDHFPLAVQVTLATKENNKEYEISSVIPIEFPNNKPEPPTNANPNAAANAAANANGATNFVPDSNGQ